MTMPKYATLALRGRRIIDNSWKRFVEALLIPPQVCFSHLLSLLDDRLLTLTLSISLFRGH